MSYMNNIIINIIISFRTDVGDNFNIDSLHKIIDYYIKSIINYEDWKKYFNFQFRDIEEYTEYSQFINDVQQQGYKISFKYIKEDKIHEMVSNNQMYLFQIYTKDFSDRSLSYVPPSPIFTINEKGKFSKPYTYNYKREFDPNLLETTYKLDRSHKYYIKFLSNGMPYKAFGIIPMKRHLITVENEGRLYLLGGDINGRDVFSRLLFGGRISMTIGFLALFILFRSSVNWPLTTDH